MIGIEWDVQGRRTLAHPSPWVQIRDAGRTMFQTLGAVFSPKSDVSAQHLSGFIGIMRVYYSLFQDPVRLAARALVQRRAQREPRHPEPAALPRARRRPHHHGHHRRPSAAARSTSASSRSCRPPASLLLLGFMVFVSFKDAGDIFGAGQKSERQSKKDELEGAGSRAEVPRTRPACPRREVAGTAMSAHSAAPLLPRPLPLPAPPNARGAWSARSASAATIPIRVQSMITCDTLDTAACVQADARPRRRRLRDRPHHRADGEGRGEPASTSSPACAPRAATCRSSPTSISSPTPRWRPRSGSRRCASIPATTPTRRSSRSANTPTSNTPRNSQRIEERFAPLVQLCKERGARHAHRHQSRLAQRPHHEPLRRHAARHGRERAGVRPHRPRRTTTTTSSSR